MHNIRLRRGLSLTLLITFLSVGLSACGKKGPLYLPDEQAKKAQVNSAKFTLINVNNNENNKLDNSSSHRSNS